MFENGKEKKQNMTRVLHLCQHAYVKQNACARVCIGFHAHRNTRDS